MRVKNTKGYRLGLGKQRVSPRAARTTERKERGGERGNDSFATYKVSFKEKGGA
jgi:hypothetical protein